MGLPLSKHGSKPGNELQDAASVGAPKLQGAAAVQVSRVTACD